MNAEGWYVDPFGSHEARWFSDGTPTNLVRDDGQVAHDDPPNATYEGSLTPVEASGEDTPGDLRRADDGNVTSVPDKEFSAVFDPWTRFPPNRDGK